MRNPAQRWLARVLATILLLAAIPVSSLAVTGSPAYAGVNCGEPPFNAIIPEGFFGNQFSSACAHHDVCYWGGTHGFPWEGNRAACDWRFYLEMIVACDRAFWSIDPRRYWCGSEALVFYGAVRAVGRFYWDGRPQDNV